MHNFLIHSNESLCRKGWRLGMDQVSEEKSRKLVVSKFSSNVLSKCVDANFHMTCVICVSNAKYVAPPVLSIPGKWFNRDVIIGCNI